jgi:small-conductance mechanosensitive channel
VISTAVAPLAARARWLQRGAQRAFVAIGIAVAVAALAALLGYLELSDFLGGGALAIVYLAIGVLAFRVAAAGAVWLALVESPLSRLRAIDRNRLRTEAGLSRALDLVSVGLWIAFSLQTFELLDPTVAFVAAALDANLKVGELSISVGRVLGFFAVVAIAWLTAHVVIFALEEDVYPRMRLARGVPYALSSIVRYGLLLAGFFAALATLGLDLTHLTVLVSAFGLGLGFGMQQIINNFVSGLILLFERPVQVGDLVQMKDLNGEVLRIGIRSSTIRTPDGAEVIIPNSDLIQNDVTNWTLSDRRRRLTIDVGVAYGVAAERVLALLVEVASRDARVVTAPGPEALFIGFGASSLDFQLRFWTDESKWWTLKSDVTVALQSALREAGIEVPFTTITLLSPETPR